MDDHHRLGAEAPFETVRVRVRGGAAWLTLDRPAALNAMTEQMHHEIARVLDLVRDDRDVRALVVTGAGERAFCIGSDLQFLDDAYAPGRLHVFRDYLERLNRLLRAFEELPVPTIAMVNGKARASGFELIVACDLVLVAEEARLGDVHTPYGHLPGGGATQRTARKIGMQRALELIWTGRWLTGRQAVACGLALDAVPRADLQRRTEQLVADLVDKPRDTLTYIKRVTLRGWDLPLPEGVALEAQTYLEYLATSPDPLDAFRANQARRAAGVTAR